MGFFNKILKGLGFEDDKPQERNKQVTTKNTKPINATYNFEKNEKKVVKENKEQSVKDVEVFGNTFSIDVVKIQKQDEVQDVILRLKNGEKLIVNFSELEEMDIVRCLDFLSGAIFVLGKSIKKIESFIFLVE